MRLNSLTIAAVGLLILGVILTVRLSGSKTPAAEETGLPPGHSRSLVNSASSARLDAKSPSAAIPRNSFSKNALSSPEILGGNPTDNRPVGIRLADNVQLPAVVLAINAVENNPQSTLPEPVAAAMHAIVDTFYQDLAESSRQNGSVTSPDEEGTVVIQPGPAVESARARANETYRALFGDDAFNRLTVNTALEVRIPVNPAPDEN